MTRQDTLGQLEKLIGLELTSYKKQQLERRLAQFWQRRGYRSEASFISALEADRGLQDALRSNITINTSEFFRDPVVFELFRKEILPELISRTGVVRVWSAAASIGAEIYSVAMLLAELAPSSPRKHRLLATDIDTAILEQARAGTFTEDKLKNVSAMHRRKYFTEQAGRRISTYILDPAIKDSVHFRQLDLLKDPYPRPFDMILCRNVLIYFERDAQRRVINKLTGCLRDGGYLILGTSEVIFDPSEEGLHRVGPSVYQLRQTVNRAVR